MNLIERRRRGLGSSASRTYHLTLIGAKNDVITIKDSGGNAVGTCTFPSGATQGTIDVSGNPSELYTFTSSIAKDTTSGTSAYSKQMYLSDDAMKVMPDGAIYWCGNYVKPMQSYTYLFLPGYTAKSPTLTPNNNQIVTELSRTSSSSDASGAYMTTSKVGLTNYSKVCALGYGESPVQFASGNYIFLHASQTNTAMSDDDVRKSILGTLGIFEIDVTALTGDYYIGLMHVNGRELTYTRSHISQIWCE